MKLSRTLVLSLLLAVAGTSSAAADEAADLQARLEVLARAGTAERLASYAYNLYEALLARGFGQEQAMRLVTAFASAGPAGDNCGATSQ